ncbi:hypothetical protein KIN20_011808 [Parelaphostrongylus tenuis]|uniref:Uncharacterized protein n=1 Tax=Parelaphostrongylus tenuis TaxID=148309 RepID=A0AAD5MU60_PARTN|nr:hypothetical protein KIN20_011808 [Parelaphostrongylus tenuis]
MLRQLRNIVNYNNIATCHNNVTCNNMITYDNIITYNNTVSYNNTTCHNTVLDTPHQSVNHITRGTENEEQVQQVRLRQ